MIKRDLIKIINERAQIIARKEAEEWARAGEENLDKIVELDFTLEINGKKYLIGGDIHYTADIEFEDVNVFEDCYERQFTISTFNYEIGNVALIDNDNNEFSLETLKL